MTLNDFTIILVADLVVVTTIMILIMKESKHEQIQICMIWGFHSGGFEVYHLLGYDVV
jgi:hypothetical protein